MRRTPPIRLAAPWTEGIRREDPFRPSVEDDYLVPPPSPDASSGGKLLGAHLRGPQAATPIQPLVIAMTLGIDAQTLAKRGYWIDPALTEVVSNALLILTD
ncbi:hypothetical protein [Kribbella capetownensis]|uniref:hypothetical protein n=1 Tax=Kribbella capetownensis TaxID=1572659 RepID=UPI00192E19DE|nr:hypothetical protein [Kribbella capetownensis]